VAEAAAHRQLILVVVDVAELDITTVLTGQAMRKPAVVVVQIPEVVLVVTAGVQAAELLVVVVLW
jgi:hypothetical protein